LDSSFRAPSSHKVNWRQVARRAATYVESHPACDTPIDYAARRRGDLICRVDGMETKAGLRPRTPWCLFACRIDNQFSLALLEIKS
jgi:hypothetical protein